MSGSAKAYQQVDTDVFEGRNGADREVLRRAEKYMVEHNETSLTRAVAAVLASNEKLRVAYAACYSGQGLEE